MIPLLAFVCALCMAVCKSVQYCKCVLYGVIQECICTCGISRHYRPAPGCAFNLWLFPSSASEALPILSPAKCTEAGLV